MARIVLAMSGGVDSSVAAHLLRNAGHEVIGLFMRHGETHESSCASDRGHSSSTLLPVLSGRPDHKQGCCSASDADDARRVAHRLDIPFYALDLSADFGRIIDYFVSEYTSARTPNPCVMCNNWLKFGKLFDYADSIGAEFVATGHYARLEAVAGNLPRMIRGLDHAKDQSYVLFGVHRKLLSRMLFPVGDHRKDQIRQMARNIGLRVAEKRDSQEICFVASGDHAEFIRRRARNDTSGQIVTSDGTVVGRHEGLEGFTIGQRKGLGVALGEPRYVIRLEADTRRVIIGTRDELARTTFKAERANWLADAPAGAFRCLVQVRYNSPAVPATVTPVDSDRFEVTLDEPRHGVAPGQAAVCYDGDRVLGGGWIA